MQTNVLKRNLQIGISTGLLLTAASAHAHFPWVAVPDYSLATNKTSPVHIMTGHSFPLDSILEEDRLGSLELVHPDGSRSGLEKSGAMYMTPELKGGGAYVLLATQKSSFYTRTKSGGKRQSKEGLSDVIKCSYSARTMKAVLNVGAGDGMLSSTFDQPLEIIPLTNPVRLRVNDYLDVQVLLHWKPYNGMVYATYSGFSPEEHTYAYAVTTNDEGKASIRILATGAWLVRANVEQPYPDTRICDVESYNATLTFGIQ